MEEEIAKTTGPKPDTYKALFFGLLFIVTVTIVGGTFYYLGEQQQAKNSPTGKLPLPMTPSPAVVFPPDEIETSTVAEEQKVKDEAVVPIGPNTVSFARVEENTYLRYRDKIYDDSNQFELHEVQLLNPDQYSWYGLVDAPAKVVPNEFMNDEVFGFKVAPDKKSFAFVMRWNSQESPEKASDYYLFYYTPFDKFRQSILVKKFPVSDPSKIDQYSPDSKFLSLNLFDCWNCGGHKPETMLVRLTDNEMKNIAKTSFFNWLADGKYEYKDYIVKPCSQETMGECFEEPEKLSLKTGQF